MRRMIAPILVTLLATTAAGADGKGATRDNPGADVKSGKVIWEEGEADIKSGMVIWEEADVDVKPSKGVIVTEEEQEI